MNPGRFGPIPVRSGLFDLSRFGPISGVSRFQGSYRREKTKFPDISLTQIQISLTKTIGDRQNIFSPKLVCTMRQ